MTKIRFRLFASICFMMLFTTLPITAQAASTQKPILEMIPSEAIGFIVLNDLSRIDEAAAILSEKTQLPIPGPVMIMKIATGMGDVIDSKGNLAALFFAKKSKASEANAPTAKEIAQENISTHAVLLLPVSDFEKLVAIFEESEKVKEGIYKVEIASTSILLASKDGYALLAPEESHEMMDLVLKTRTNVVEQCKPWKEWIDQQIFYGFLTQTGLETYGPPAIEGISSLLIDDQEIILEEIQESDESEADDTGIATPKFQVVQNEQREKFKNILTKIHDSIGMMAVGMKVEDSGITRVSLRWDIRPGSQLSKDLEKLDLAPEDLLASLPPGPFVFAGSGPKVNIFAELYSKWSEEPSLVPNTKKDNPLEILDDCRFLREHLLYDSLFVGPPNVEQAGIENMWNVSWVSDIEKAFDAIKKDMEVQKKMFKNLDAEIRREMQEADDEETEKQAEQKDLPEKTLMKISTKETTIAGYRTLVVTYEVSGLVKEIFGEMEAFMPMLLPIFEKYYGDDFKSKEYIIQIDDHRILSTSCNDPEIQKKFIKIAKMRTGGFADKPDIKKVAAMLPAGAQWKVFWSPYGTTKFLDWLIEVSQTVSLLQQNMPFDKLPEFKKSLPVGIAGVASKELFEVTIVLPPDALCSSIQYCMQIQALFQTIEEEF